MSVRARRAAGRAACWQVADEHTSPGRGRAGTDAPQGHGEMLVSPVKTMVGFKKQGQGFGQHRPLNHSRYKKKCESGCSVRSRSQCFRAALRRPLSSIRTTCNHAVRLFGKLLIKFGSSSTWNALHLSSGNKQNKRSLR